MGAKIKVGDTLYFIPTYKTDWHHMPKPGTPCTVVVTKVGTKYIETNNAKRRIKTRLAKNTLREVGGWGGRA
jgi:hypothetical protein